MLGWGICRLPGGAVLLLLLLLLRQSLAALVAGESGLVLGLRWWIWPW